MHDSFGARLRQRREERQVALSTIAEQTKIKLSLLEALERDDVSRWPSGIFRRAYIRAYAHAIGLCPDETVREFLALHPEPDDAVVTVDAIAAAADPAGTAGGPPSRLRLIVGSAFGSLSRLRRPPAIHQSAGPGVSRAVEPEIREEVVPMPEERSETLHQAEAPHVTVATAGRVTPGERPPVAPDPDLASFARLCTALGRAGSADALPPILKEVAEMLQATGLILWVWDPEAEELVPALAHGYSDAIIAQLPGVTRDDDNPTAAAFRLGELCALEGNTQTSGALVVPMLTPGGCTGALALELRHRGEQSPSIRSCATILAALLAQLVGTAPPAEAAPEEHLPAAAV